MQICRHNLQHCSCPFLYLTYWFTYIEPCQRENTYRITALHCNWSINLFLQEVLCFVFHLHYKFSALYLGMLLGLFNQWTSSLIHLSAIIKIFVITIRLPVKLIKYLGQTACILEFQIREKIIIFRYVRSGQFSVVKIARKMTVLPAGLSISKSIQILETLSKTAHQSPLYQRLLLCSLEAICPISGLCVSTSTKGSETNKERTVKPELMLQFLKTNF